MKFLCDRPWGTSLIKDILCKMIFFKEQFWKAVFDEIHNRKEISFTFFSLLGVYVLSGVSSGVPEGILYYSIENNIANSIDYYNSDNILLKGRTRFDSIKILSSLYLSKLYIHSFNLHLLYFYVTIYMLPSHVISHVTIYMLPSHVCKLRST